jgi:hypothetical protein
MRRGTWILLFIFSLFVSPIFAQATKEQAPEFELQLGNSKYDVAEGKTFSIVTPKGERVELVLRRKEVLHFAEHGVSFNYDSSMKVEVTKELGVVTIAVESIASPIAMIQIHSIPAKPNEVRDVLLQTLRDEYKSRGAEFLEGSGGTVKRQFRGMDREGQYFEFLLGGERMRAEIYAFQKGDTVMSIMFQHLTSDVELAKKHFLVISNSLQ